MQQLNYRPPRKERNPRTSEPVMVSANHIPHFKGERELKERVNI
jgi:integration host factor subunit beta